MSAALNEDNLIRILDHEGNLNPEIPQQFRPYVDELGDTELLEAYRLMRMQRAFDEAATALQRQGELGLWPPSRGQEGAQIGSGLAQGDKDYVFPSYREHGVALTRGLPLTDLMGLFRGTDYGSWNPVTTRFHQYALVIGSHLLHATGYAMGITRDGSDERVTAYFGDGATAQGDVNEAMVFASVNKAPVLFFCQNNQYAISVSTSGQSATEIAQRPSGFGIPSLRIDGNDVIASYAATRIAQEHMDAGNGPFFIEAFTYRMGAHTTSDDPTKYRASDEEAYWAQRDPITRLETYLRNRDALTAQFDENLRSEITAMEQEIRAYTLELPTPPTERMFAHVYGEAHAQVQAEAEWMVEYMHETSQEDAS